MPDSSPPLPLAAAPDPAAPHAPDPAAELARLDGLARPRLLIGAARFGLAEWRRERDLRRLLRRPDLPAPGGALAELIRLEAAQDEIRTQRAACYVIARHVEILTALMAEARLLRDVLRPAAPCPEPTVGTAADEEGTTRPALRIAGARG